jgi:hypothetical protein
VALNKITEESAKILDARYKIQKGGTLQMALRLQLIINNGLLDVRY